MNLLMPNEMASEKKADLKEGRRRAVLKELGFEDFEYARTTRTVRTAERKSGKKGSFQKKKKRRNRRKSYKPCRMPN